MNFQVLKSDFKDYLAEKHALSGKDQSKNEDVSIFMHAEEFRQFLAEEYGADTKTCYKNLSEILKLEVVDGELVDPEAEDVKNNSEIMDAIKEESAKQELEAKTLEAVENPDVEIDDEAEVEEVDDTSDIGIDSVGVQAPLDETQGLGILGTTTAYASENGVDFEDPELITGILNDLLTDKDFKKAIDKDGDGKIGKEDLEAFYDSVKCYDDDENTISLEDIISAVEDICEGTFRWATDEEYEEEIGEPLQKVDDGVTPQSHGIQGIPSSGGGGSYSSGGGAVKEIEKYDANGKAIIQNMTIPELQEELGKAQTAVVEKEKAYEDIQNGTDPELTDLQGQIDKAYEEFEKAVGEQDKGLAESITKQKGLITDKKKQISEKETEITKAETEVTEAETALANATARRQALEAQLTTLEAEKGKENAPKDISEKITALNQEIAKAKEEEQKAKETRDKAKEALQAKQGEKKDLDTELTSLNTDMGSLEAQVTPEIQEKFMKPYKELQEKYGKTKEEKAQAAKAALVEAQKYVTELETGIAAKQTSSDISSKYSVNNGQQVLEQAYKYLGMSERQFESASGKAVPDGLWCAAFVHEILKETVGTENLPDWYENCNYNGCGSVLNAARQNGAAFTDANEAQPGDLVIFRTNRSDTGHIGFVVKVENGVVYTIEGNTSSQVGERQYQAGSNRINSFVRMPRK